MREKRTVAQWIATATSHNNVAKDRLVLSCYIMGLCITNSHPAAQGMRGLVMQVMNIGLGVASALSWQNRSVTEGCF